MNVLSLHIDPSQMALRLSNLLSQRADRSAVSPVPQKIHRNQIRIEPYVCCVDPNMSSNCGFDQFQSELHHTSPMLSMTDRERFSLPAEAVHTECLEVLDGAAYCPATERDQGMPVLFDAIKLEASA